MKEIHIKLDQSPGNPYANNTGRWLEVPGTQGTITTAKRVVFIGDSTIDNGHWVDQGKRYADKTHTVPFQTAARIAQKNLQQRYELVNLSVDGARTKDVLHAQSMAGVIAEDEDHLNKEAKQLDALKALAADTVVLSVGGNDYRVALQSTLRRSIPSVRRLLCRLTPESSKATLKKEFNLVKIQLLDNYKKIIDRLIEENPQMTRLVLVSQYYPALTMITAYFIYTGFSHIAAAEGKGESAFTAMQATMETLYNDIIDYVASKNKEIVFADMTSSLNPVKGYYSHQIEPNERGSVVMGRLLAAAVTHQFKDNERAKTILRLAADEKTITSQPLPREQETYTVRSIDDFIKHSRYCHWMPSADSSLVKRVMNTYYIFAGKHFDAQYGGLFALGLLDLSLVTIMAAYLWRVAIHAKTPAIIRAPAFMLATPVLIIRALLAAALALASFPLILLVHDIMSFFRSKPPARCYSNQQQLFHSLDQTEKLQQQGEGKGGAKEFIHSLT